ncbi:MAG: CRISPR-associated helicase Cas3' [Burkholderiales bacterium]|jgi:CRISPR-associated endonuclease/helicase Cas3|nr:CRISPR-associated helicase Cas3' [Burkholderiales bacterium]
MPVIDLVEPWGKLDRNDSSRRLSLVGHCIDVAAVFSALVEMPTMRRRFEQLAGRPLNAVDLERLAALAFLHDVGKAGSGFYSKGESDEVASAWRRRNNAGQDQFGHTTVIEPLLRKPAYAGHAQVLGLDTWGEWWPDDGARKLWLAAVSHHGQPITADTLPHALRWPTWVAPIAGYNPLDGLARLGQAVRRLWPDAFSEPVTPPLAEPFTHAFAGLVSLADWIGSNTDHFPYDFAAQDESRWHCSLTRAHRALKEIGLDLSAQQAELAARAPSFQDLFGFPPKPMQQAAATRLGQPLVVLEAETGSGKTEAALWRFTQLFQAREVDALCFLLPTRVAASGIYARLQGYVERAFPDPVTRPAWVLAVPGDLRANGAHGERQPGLPFADVLWPDAEAPEARFWAAEHSKRYFAAGLLAGTIDQFLLSALRTGHAHLRAALSLRSFVVVDEVHASDPYMARLLRHALARHAAAGGHAMLLSATLTGAARSALIAAGQPRTPVAFGRRPSQLPADLSRADAPYPCLSHAQGLDDIAPDGTASKQVRATPLDAMREPERIAACVQQALEQGQRVLVLRNTVGQALATQRALEAQLGPDHPALFRVNGQPVLHHGRYARVDRQQLDAEVERCFGKGAAHSLRPVVLVGTQTLEISVDCDADLLITDLCPMDVLLQRLGRLHRHAKRHELRPGGAGLAQAHVLVPSQRNLAALLRPDGARGLGLGPKSAYPNLLAVEASWRELERGEDWLIPQHNRRLVEACCDEATLSAMADALSGDWPAHRNDLFGKAAGQRMTADAVSLDWLKPWDEMAPGELIGEARTRLGLDALPLDVPTWITPLGQPLKRLDIPAWMWPAEPKSLTQAVFDDGEHGVLRFEAGGKRFSYSRFGLERLD